MTSYDGIPEGYLSRARGLHHVARTRFDPNLCKEPRLWLFNHVIGCVQSQPVTCKHGDASNRLSSPHTDRYRNTVSTISAHYCPPMAAISAHQWQQSVPTSATNQCPLAKLVSAGNQCRLSVLPINAHRCPSVPPITA
ncbi:hypothetical protein AB205_0053180, partial [Aquarana catesbeiana]